MGTLFRELCVHLFGQMFDGMDVILGVLVAFAWWCLDYAVIERRHRPHHAIVLALAAALVLGVVIVPNWSGKTLLRAAVMAVLVYLPLRIGGQVSRARKGQ